MKATAGKHLQELLPGFGIPTKLPEHPLKLLRDMALFLSLLLIAGLGTADPERVVVEPETFELEVGATKQLAARVYDENDNLVEDVRIRWFSGDRGVATVDEEGRVTALAPGEVQITAVVVAGRALRASATLTVQDLPPSEVVAALPGEANYAGTSAPLQVTVRNSLGTALPAGGVTYQSSDPAVASVDAWGRVYFHKPGRATVTLEAGPATTRVDVAVVDNPAGTYELIANVPGAPLSVRTGDVVRFSVQAQGGPSMALFPAWSVGAPGASIEEDGPEGVFVAEQPGTYRVTALIGDGATQTTTVNVTERRYNASLTKVGRGPISSHSSADTWVFEGIDGHDYAYIGTFMYDWMMVWDVTDPNNPILTDSVQVDARRINDVKIHPNNRIGVITREGASSRRNGIVLLDLSTPAHPTILSEYTDTVTGGVHNVWIRGEEDLIYAVHNGTRDIHIIDISDPEHPEEVGRWGLDKEVNKSLHDVIVQDGYAYLSYWDDGLIMLDAGAGTHGGTPTRPTFVSQYKYPVGNTHTAWRDGRYLFVGDEIFPSEWTHTAPIEARGYIHVLDMADIENPVEVARYEVPEAGAHNVWVEDGKLYVGYYQGGLRVVDITGELRGDLYRQGREMAALKTTDQNAHVANWPMTFSAQIFKGLIYSADFNSGLWITRLEEGALVP